MGDMQEVLQQSLAFGRSGWKHTWSTEDLQRSLMHESTTCCVTPDKIEPVPETEAWATCKKGPWGGTRQTHLNIIECELSESIAGCIFSRDQSTWGPPLHCCIYCYQATLRTVAHFRFVESEGKQKRASTSTRARARAGSGAGEGWGQGQGQGGGQAQGQLQGQVQGQKHDSSLLRIVNGCCKV